MYYHKQDLRMQEVNLSVNLSLFFISSFHCFTVILIQLISHCSKFKVGIAKCHAYIWPRPPLSNEANMYIKTSLSFLSCITYTKPNLCVSSWYASSIRSQFLHHLCFRPKALKVIAIRVAVQMTMTCVTASDWQWQLLFRYWRRWFHWRTPAFNAPLIMNEKNAPSFPDRIFRDPRFRTEFEGSNDKLQCSKENARPIFERRDCWKWVAIENLAWHRLKEEVLVGTT